MLHPTCCLSLEKWLCSPSKAWASYRHPLEIGRDVLDLREYIRSTIRFLPSWSASGLLRAAYGHLHNCFWLKLLVLASRGTWPYSIDLQFAETNPALP